MNSRTSAAVAVVAAILLVGGFMITMQLGGVSTTSTGSHTTTATTTGTIVTTTSTGANAASPNGLQLQLSVNASSSDSTHAMVFQIAAREFNTLSSVNNVTKGDHWPVSGLSLGPCGTAQYPFGLALYRGTYSASNASEAKPLQIYPIVACPMLIRYITGYLFQPRSDGATILPSGPNATATPMMSNVTATAEYTGSPTASSSYTPLSPGTYTVAAGDEWGSLALVHISLGQGASTSSSTSSMTGVTGMLSADLDIGPTQPVCRANSTVGPPPPQYTSVEAVITSQASGQSLVLSVPWLSNGCSVYASLQASLPAGSYSLNLSNCTFMGCRSSLPKSFVIAGGQSTVFTVSIDTGIR